MDKISKFLDAATSIESRAQLQITKTDELINDSVISELTVDSIEDFKNAKTNIRELISIGMEVLPDMLVLIRESENNKMYESAAIFMKTLADLNVKLVDVDKKVPSSLLTTDKPPESGGNTTNNFVFTGTTAELMAHLSDKDKKEKEVKTIIEHEQ